MLLALPGLSAIAEIMDWCFPFGALGAVYIRVFAIKAARASAPPFRPMAPMPASHHARATPGPANGLTRHTTCHTCVGPASM